MERGGPGATAGALPLSRLPRLLPKPMETRDVPKSPPPPNAGENSRSTAPIVDVGLRELAKFAPAFQRDPLDVFLRLRAAFGPSIAFERPGRSRDRKRTVVVTCDPALIHDLVTDPTLRSSGLTIAGEHGSSHRRIRQGLFRMHGDEHRRHRLLIGGTLQKKAVETTAATMAVVVDDFANEWRPGSVRDLAADMKELARRVAATILFGLGVEESARIGAMAEDWWADNFKTLPQLLEFDWPGLPYHRMHRKAERLESVLLDVIARRREALADSGTDDLLAGLIRAGDERGALSDAELVGHTSILFLAAHETTAYALTWTLLLLSQHPNTAVRLVDELDGQLGGRAPLPSDELPFLGRVIRESLRVLPVVPYVTRVAQAPLTLGGREFSRRTRAILPFYAMHLDPELFPEPRRFDPDRFAGPEPTPYTYLPFGAGPHLCVGINFAQQTLRIALATLLQRFRFTLVEGTRVDHRVTVTIAPKRAIPIRVEAPDAAFERVALRGSINRLVDWGPLA